MYNNEAEHILRGRLWISA